MLFEFRHFLKPYMARGAKKRKFRGLYRLHLHLCLTQSLAVDVSASRPFSSNFVRLALDIFGPSASLAGLMSSTRVPLTLLLSLKQCDPQSLR